MNSILSVLALLLLLAGCSLFGLGDSSSAVNTDETFTLREGESVRLANANATLRFVDKMADSRCPLGVDCVWEGEVKVMLSFALDGQAPADVELVGYVGPDGDGAVSADALGFRFTLQRLDPYPVDGAPSDDPVTATLKVKRL